jgi:hypothetical protein
MHSVKKKLREAQFFLDQMCEQERRAFGDRSGLTSISARFSMQREQSTIGFAISSRGIELGVRPGMSLTPRKINSSTS